MQLYEEKYFKILLVAKNQRYRDTLASKLRIQGFTVEFVDSGFHLMHLIEKTKDISLVIFHENMHDMPAEESISLIRLIYTKNELPILFISKSNNEEDICDMVFAGANEYIVESPNFHPIVERAMKYFNQKKGQKAS